MLLSKQTPPILSQRRQSLGATPYPEVRDMAQKLRTEDLGSTSSTHVAVNNCFGTLVPEDLTASPVFP